MPFLHAVRLFALSILFVPVATTTLAQSTARPPEPGTVRNVEWSDDGKELLFTSDGSRHRLDLVTLERSEAGVDEPDDVESVDGAASRPRRTRDRGTAGASTGEYVGRPKRGRQYTQVDSPDGKWEAHYRDWNVVLQHKENGEVVRVTEDGTKDIHYGTASWVYGEELNQRRAMWWTPDSKKLVYYRFDDTDVEVFHLVTGWSEVNTEYYPEYYPKAGAKNPAAELWVYDMASGSKTRIDAGGSGDEYVYGVRATPDGSTMLVNWTDRLQQHLKVLAIDLEAGAARVVVEERQDTWQRNSPPMRFLADGKRFLWPTDRSGFTHYELRALDGRLINAVTSGDFQTARIQFVDEEAGLMGFTAYSSPENPYYLQYHVVGLDGTEQRRVTTVERHHSSFSLSPDKRWLVARYEDVNTPPCTALYRIDGSLAATLAESDPATAADLAEMFRFRSSDDRFDIYGILYKPADFDPEKSYPLINALYGGPGSSEISARYVSTPRPECLRGYLAVKVNNRGTANRGKAFLGAAYLRHGEVDIQDHADAVRLLRERPYVDGERVGITGSSYGGFMAAMGVLKHHDVYEAAVVGSGVTDWRNYDTIYTERYMSTPQLNPEGYAATSAMKYVKDFTGKMLIMHGMVDDNVHATNAFQLIEALDEAGKAYESRFWPNKGHGVGAGASKTKWEFFDRVLRPEAPQN